MKDVESQLQSVTLRVDTQKVPELRLDAVRLTHSCDQKDQVSDLATVRSPAAALASFPSSYRPQEASYRPPEAQTQTTPRHERAASLISALSVREVLKERSERNDQTEPPSPHLATAQKSDLKLDDAFGGTIRNLSFPESYKSSRKSSRKTSRSHSRHNSLDRSKSGKSLKLGKKMVYKPAFITPLRCTVTAVKDYGDTTSSLGRKSAGSLKVRKRKH